MHELTVEIIRELLDYEPKIGIFRWKVCRSGVAFGSIAGTITEKGHRRIHIGRKSYYAARLAWIHYYGEWPKGVVDHRNRIRDDNRIENLRDAEFWQNATNMRFSKKPQSGSTGVAPNKDNWSALITHKGKRIYLGTFKTVEEASKVYEEARNVLHREFAPCEDMLPPIDLAIHPKPLVKPTKNTTLTIERLKQIISYDKDTGILKRYFKKSNGHDCQQQVTSKNVHGYISIMIDGRRYPAHRLAWFYVRGQMPNSWIDHINGIRDDNRICNLRLATPKENSRNVSGWKNKKHPLKGVYPQKKRWQSAIRVNGKLIYLGSFEFPEQAHNAYLKAAKEHFGEFARGYP